MGELIVNGIKWAFLVGVGIVFASAIMTLVNFIGTIAFGSIVGEVLAVFDACLPFSLSGLMASVFLVGGVMIAFLVAQKIFTLTLDITPK